MTVYRGSKTGTRIVECCAVGCDGDMLDRTLKDLNAEGWNIRQIFQEITRYRIFAQRELPADGTDVDGREAEAIGVIRDNPGLSLRDISRKLQELGIKRSKSWVGNKKSELFNAARP